MAITAKLHGEESMIAKLYDEKPLAAQLSGNGTIITIPGEDGKDGIGIASLVQTTISAEEGGTNIITATLTDGTTSTFEIKNGSKGPAGTTGATGPQGAQGEKGEKGDKGDTGATGPQGEKGDKGDTGAAGSQGAKGDKGDKGDTGNSGVYIGSGTMPADCNVQIDPNGDAFTSDELVQAVLAALPVYDGSVVSV